MEAVYQLPSALEDIVTQRSVEAIGYQYGHTDAFAERQPGVTLEENHVDGLSITYSHQRSQHIWTYAYGSSELRPYFSCPCST